MEHSLTPRPDLTTFPLGLFGCAVKKLTLNNMVCNMGISGFGRIGRLVCRAACERGDEVSVKAVNDPSSSTTAEL